MAPKYIHFLISETYKYITLNGKSDFIDVM